MSSSAWAECGNLCDYKWWETATASDVQAELDAGADVNTRNEYGTTPLLLAAQWGTAKIIEETIEALITAGADITAKDELGRSVWDLAQTNEKLAGNEALWALAEALGKCARLCDYKWWETATASDVQAELDAGADVNTRNEGGTTPLHWAAASRGNAEEVLLLITAGANVNTRNEDGDTPLHWAAASRGNAEEVLLLITAGANVNARDETGYTPLHWAGEYGNTEMVQLLITAGVDVNTRAEGGRTPLLSASILGTAEMVQLLITAGADITAKDNRGRSVWDLAQTNAKLAGTEALWLLAEALGKCSRWCDADWWKQATAADLQALLDAVCLQQTLRRRPCNCMELG